MINNNDNQGMRQTGVDAKDPTKIVNQNVHKPQNLKRGLMKNKKESIKKAKSKKLSDVKRSKSLGSLP